MAGKPKTLISISQAESKIIIQARLTISLKLLKIYSALIVAMGLTVCAWVLSRLSLSPGDVMNLLTQWVNIAKSLASIES